ncbi:MAG TPA: ABC transporter ATP-binding protein [Verrucomicrobiae bacterium]|nr:ABC transporter ATP-binding protein [Verrucomicrobiae bacterium]
MQNDDITPPKPVIHLKKLTKQFGHDDTAFFALNGVDLAIDKGEFVAIMGPSGSGKTTLLNILGLLDTASDGEYHLDGTPVDTISHHHRARIRASQIGFVFQNFNLLHRLTVIENVALPLTYTGQGRVTRLESASDMLKTFHLQEREYYMPHQLSGGQLQRVAIARALVNQPSIILADEPTGNLDSKSSEIIMSELSDIHKRGNTIIMVTHNPDLTVHADRVIQMLDGQIASDTKHPEPEPDPTEKRPLGKIQITVRNDSEPNSVPEQPEPTPEPEVTPETAPQEEPKLEELEVASKKKVKSKKKKSKAEKQPEDTKA